jgi:hypothetical protein
LPDLLPANDYEFRKSLIPHFTGAGPGVHVAGPLQGAVPLPPQLCAQVAISLHAVRHPATTAVILPALEDFEPECKVALLEELGKPCLMAG